MMKNNATPKRITPMKGQLKPGPVPTPDFSFMRELIVQYWDLSDAMSLDEPWRFEPPFVTLPTEILSQVCAVLRNGHELDALASLRLTCRRLTPVVNEHLFSTVFLNRRIDSVMRLTKISRSPLARFVLAIDVDAESVFADMTWIEWLMNINDFGRVPVPIEDQWWGRQTYEQVLAQERDTISSDTELRGRWLIYQLELASERRLGKTRTRVLNKKIRLAFSRLPNLKAIEARACMLSKYVIPPVGRVHTDRSSRSVFRRTLTLPRIRRTSGNPAVATAQAVPDRFQSDYVTIILEAAMRYSPDLQHINILGAHRSTLTRFQWTPDFVEPCTMPNVTSIVIAPVCRVSHTHHNIDELVKFLTLAPNLKKLKSGGLQAPQRSPRHPIGLNALQLHSLDAPLTQLEDLTLRDVLMPASELHALIRRLPPTMLRLQLCTVTISGGSWVDIFECMHNEKPLNCQVRLFGVFLEGTAWRITDIWTMFKTSNEENGLQRKVIKYIHDPNAPAPLRPILQGGSSGEWRQASDDTMRYTPPEAIFANFPWRRDYFRRP